MSRESENPSEEAVGRQLILKQAQHITLFLEQPQQKKATSKTSGDSYSLIKIDNDKFMMALCDGMGSGKKAEKSFQSCNGPS